RVGEGITHSPVSGDYAIRLLDRNGQVTYEMPFKAPFVLLSHPPERLDSMPFAYALPYVTGAAQMQVTHSGQVLAQTQIASKLITDAVNQIPDGGFTQNAAQQRGALLQQAQQF